MFQPNSGVIEITCEQLQTECKKNGIKFRSKVREPKDKACWPPKQCWQYHYTLAKAHTCTRNCNKIANKFVERMVMKANEKETEDKKEEKMEDSGEE